VQIKGTVWNNAEEINENTTSHLKTNYYMNHHHHHYWHQLNARVITTFFIKVNNFYWTLTLSFLPIIVVIHEKIKFKNIFHSFSIFLFLMCTFVQVSTKHFCHTSIKNYRLHFRTKKVQRHQFMSFFLLYTFQKISSYTFFYKLFILWVSVCSSFYI
jgi:hypothetical protein